MYDHFRRDSRRRPLLVLAGLAAAGLALSPASVSEAHVRVQPDNASSGGFSALTFRVPNESDTAGTVKVSVELPQDTPFAYVSSKPVPGWTVSAAKKKLPTPYDYEGTRITEAVPTVTWTAVKGGEIGPTEYQEFSLSVGPLPDPGTILMPATQTYTDGTVVAWDEPTPASGEEPEHPAPSFAVVAAAVGDDHHGGADSAQASSAVEQAIDSTAADDDADDADDAAADAADPVARALGGLGLAAGLGALAFAVLSRRRGSGSRSSA